LISQSGTVPIAGWRSNSRLAIAARRRRLERLHLLQFALDSGWDGCLVGGASRSRISALEERSRRPARVIVARDGRRRTTRHRIGRAAVGVWMPRRARSSKLLTGRIRV
jgi:hypothetical protein